MLEATLTSANRNALTPDIAIIARALSFPNLCWMAPTMTARHTNNTTPHPTAPQLNGLPFFSPTIPVLLVVCQVRAATLMPPLRKVPCGDGGRNLPFWQSVLTRRGRIIRATVKCATEGKNFSPPPTTHRCARILATIVRIRLNPSRARASSDIQMFMSRLDLACCRVGTGLA